MTVAPRRWSSDATLSLQQNRTEAAVQRLSPLEPTPAAAHRMRHRAPLPLLGRAEAHCRSGPVRARAQKHRDTDMFTGACAGAHSVTLGGGDTCTTRRAAAQRRRGSACHSWHRAARAVPAMTSPPKTQCDAHAPVRRRRARPAAGSLPSRNSRSRSAPASASHDAYQKMHGGQVRACTWKPRPSTRSQSRKRTL
jgi:hypothetical protein